MALTFTKLKNAEINAGILQGQPNGQINYNGKNLPQQEKIYTPPVFDPTNNPSQVILTNTITGLSFTLPQDVMITLNGEKILAENNILDAINVGTTVNVVERIAREPYEIEFIFNLWLLSQSSVFPQAQINNLWQTVWLPDTVINVNNTYLNQLGISQVIVKKISPKPERGSTNLFVKLLTRENVPGQSLTISQGQTASAGGTVA